MSINSHHIDLEPDSADRQAGGPGPTSEPKLRHQPKAALCRMLSILWLFPSMGAVLILVMTEARWWVAGSFFARLSAVTFEQWIAVVILTAHPAFMWLAWRFRRTEPWKEIEPEPDPDADGDLQDPA